MDKNSYALGMSIAHNMLSSGIKEVAFDDFVSGLKAVLTGAAPEVSFDEAAGLLDKYFAELEQKQKSEAAAKRPAPRYVQTSSYSRGNQPSNRRALSPALSASRPPISRGSKEDSLRKRDNCLPCGKGRGGSR